MTLLKKWNLPYSTEPKITKKIFRQLVKHHCQGKKVLVRFRFENQLDSKSCMGLTEWCKVGWKEPETHIQEEHDIFFIYFLNQYPDKFEWLHSIFHEFTHLLFSLKKGHHRHSPRFYEAVNDIYELWIRKNNIK